MAKQTLTVQLMHATARIAELESLIDNAGALQQELYTRISTLEGELALRPRLSAPTEARLRYLASRNVNREPSDFALRCMAAKAAAMAGGKAVRV